MSVAAGPDGSIIAEKYATGQWAHSRGQRIPERYPTNREVANAIEQKISASVELFRRYRQVVWYTLFVGLYLLSLYFQANTFKSGAVVSTLKAALMPDSGSTSMTFSSEDQVLAFLGNKIIAPAWQDPVCGDSRCEVPWEFPAWGPFGCRADCGLNPNTTKVLLSITADFSGHPSISPHTLMARVSWNLCLNDTTRERRGLPPLCWFSPDQTFSDVIETQIRAVDLVDGDWFVRLEGDLAGRVTGAVYDASQGDDFVPIGVTPKWEACSFKRRRAGAASIAVRRLLSAFSVARRSSGTAADEVLHKAVSIATGIEDEREL